MTSIIIVQGAQWGSEAKGMVAAELCKRRNVQFAVRTGAVNAGHTVYKDGKKFVMQQLPTGWVAGDQCNMVIGPGAYINPEIFLREIAMVRESRYQGEIYVDYRAGLHLPEHQEESRRSSRHYLIGATGKGCAEALIDKIKNRNSGAKLFKDWFNAMGNPTHFAQDFHWDDTSLLLNEAYDQGHQILLEGTQGTWLDFNLGPYPYVTNKPCTPGQWITESGLSPALEYEVVLVARTYPIRVAGNSGPMPGEISWPELAEMINRKLDVVGKDLLVSPWAIEKFKAVRRDVAERTNYIDDNERKSELDADTFRELSDDCKKELGKLFEFTTVTHKLRRVAKLDLEMLRRSVQLCRPKYVVMTFINYEFPDLWGSTATEDHGLYLYLKKVEREIGTPIGAFTTSPEGQHYLERPWAHEPQ